MQGKQDSYTNAFALCTRRLNVVPAVFFGVFYSQEGGLSWQRLKCISKGVRREIMQ